MSSKQVASAIRTAKAISLDVAGNLSAGQDARVVAHLRNLMAVLDGIEAKLAAGNDFRAEQKLAAVMQAAFEKLDDMPAFDPSLMDAAMEKWTSLGVNFSEILQPAATVLDPSKAATPEMKAVFEAIQEEMQKHEAKAA